MVRRKVDGDSSLTSESASLKKRKERLREEIMQLQKRLKVKLEGTKSSGQNARGKVNDSRCSCSPKQACRKPKANGLRKHDNTTPRRTKKQARRKSINDVFESPVARIARLPHGRILLLSLPDCVLGLVVNFLPLGSIRNLLLASTYCRNLVDSGEVWRSLCLAHDRLSALCLHTIVMPADVWKRMYKMFNDFNQERQRLIECRKAARQRKRALTRRVQVDMCWTCPLAKCSRNFNSASRLNQHLCHHFPDAPDTRRFYCRFPLCNKSYRDLDRALRHMRNLCPLREEENRGPWFCKSCGARFEYKNACSTHLVYCQIYSDSRSHR